MCKKGVSAVEVNPKEAKETDWEQNKRWPKQWKKLTSVLSKYRCMSVYMWIWIFEMDISEKSTKY